MQHPGAHFFGFTPDTLGAWCESRGMAKYRARQILEWVYQHGVIDPSAMSNLAKRDRELLAREMTFVSCDILEHQSATDGTRKLLVEWSDQSRGRENADGEESESTASLPILGGHETTGDPTRQTECVMIPVAGGSTQRAEHASESRANRRTACISSQVGCPVGCRFCASGLGGLDGNLSAGRIVEQVWLLDQLVKGNFAGGNMEQDPNARITNVVFMGMGEPLANFASVIHAVRTLAADWGLGLGARRITISTVGLPKAIEKLAEQLELPVTLALSLHAPTDELRRELIPWAEYTSIDELLRACKAWFDKTGREITLEYILLGGVNDQPVQAAQLAGVAKSLRANVNLIRYNEVGGLPYARPTRGDVHRFQEILRERGVNAHIRASRGRDIAAACGQLRHEASGASEHAD